MATALLWHSSSTLAWISSCTNCHLSLSCGILYRSLVWLPRPARTTAMVQTKTLRLSLASARATASCAYHFLPVFTLMPVEQTLLSFESRYSSNSLALETYNPSLRPVKGSCSLFECPYRAMMLKLLSRPSHLRKNWVILRSKLYTVETGTTYISSGHSSLGRMPRW